MSRYHIRSILRANGSYFVTLIDRHTGLQPMLISLWAEYLCSTVRQNTATSYLRDLVYFLEWCDTKKISLPDRLSNLAGFRAEEINNFIAEQHRHKKDNTEFKASTINRRIRSTSEFINFQFNRYLDWKNLSPPENNSALARLSRINNAFKKNSKSSAEVGLDEQPTTSISAEQLERIRAIISPDSNTNPFKTYALKLRNYCIFELSVECLLRRSEVVLLELSDFEDSILPTITIKKPKSIIKNSNKDGASIKTNGRVMPINTDLANWLSIYIEEGREKIKKKGVITTSLFLSTKTGRRLSTGTTNLYLKELEKQYQIIYEEKITLHAHMLRVTGTVLTRREIERSLGESNSMSKHVSLEELLLHAGGWSHGSRMPSHYSRDAIIEKIRRTKIY